MQEFYIINLVADVADPFSKSMPEDAQRRLV